MRKKDLLVFATTDDAIHSIERPGSDEKDVCRVDCDTVTSEFPRTSLRNIDNRTFQKLQHALDEKLQNIASRKKFH